MCFQCSLTHCCDEAVEGLPPLCVLDGDGTEVVSEPDCGDYSPCVAVSNIFLCEAITQVCYDHKIETQTSPIHSAWSKTRTIGNFIFLLRRCRWQWVLTEFLSHKVTQSHKWLMMSEFLDNKTHMKRTRRMWNRADHMTFEIFTQIHPSKVTNPLLIGLFKIEAGEYFSTSPHFHSSQLTCTCCWSTLLKQLSVKTVLGSVFMVCWQPGGASSKSAKVVPFQVSAHVNNNVCSSKHTQRLNQTTKKPNVLGYLVCYCVLVGEPLSAW